MEKSEYSSSPPLCRIHQGRGGCAPVCKVESRQAGTGQAVGAGISELEKKRYMELSTGQKRRLHLALALTGDPDILFLDEPTAGLDVEGRASLHKEIFRLKEQGGRSSWQAMI